MKKTIEAIVVADSINTAGERITTLLLTYPRFIHAEVMTHRMFSRNTASSRAIPFNRMVASIVEDPFVPVVWQKDHAGMQGTEYFEDEVEIMELETEWHNASYEAIQSARTLYDGGDGPNVTKQICNRILEPFMWHTALVTTTEWDNFFDLRLPVYNDGIRDRWTYRKYMQDKYPDSWYDRLKPIGLHDFDNHLAWMKLSESGAEPHMQILAEAIYHAMEESDTKYLKPGEWHIPFGDAFNMADNIDLLPQMLAFTNSDEELAAKITVAVARCARLSYLTYEGNFDYGKDSALAKQLLANKHMSPFEHIARAMTYLEYDNNLIISNNKVIPGMAYNLHGFRSLRHIIETEK